MKKLLWILFLPCLLLAAPDTVITSGKWSVDANWSTGTKAGVNDTAIHKAGINDTADADFSIMGFRAPPVTGTWWWSGRTMHIGKLFVDSSTGTAHYGTNLYLDSANASMTISSGVGSRTSTSCNVYFNNRGQTLISYKSNFVFASMNIGANDTLTIPNNSGQSILVLATGTALTLSNNAKLANNLNTGGYLTLQTSTNNANLYSIGTGCAINGTGFWRFYIQNANINVNLPALTYTGSGSTTLQHVSGNNSGYTLTGNYDLGSAALNALMGAGASSTSYVNANGFNVTCGALTEGTSNASGTGIFKWGSGTWTIGSYTGAGTNYNTGSTTDSLQSCTINCGGNFTHGSNHTIVPGTSKIVFNGSSATVLTAIDSTRPFYDIEIKKDGAAACSTAGTTSLKCHEFRTTSGRAVINCPFICNSYLNLSSDTSIMPVDKYISTSFYRASTANARVDTFKTYFTGAVNHDISCDTNITLGRFIVLAGRATALTNLRLVKFTLPVASKLTITANKIVRIDSAYDIEGTVGNLDSVVSSSAGTQAKLWLRTADTLSYAYVKDINSTNPIYLDSTCRNGGGNTNVFDVSYCTGATITAEPSNSTVTLPATATYTVTASGDTPLSYQWQRNDTTIAGATSASYTTPATTTAMSGNTYRCIVTNSCGADTSARAKLYVITPGLYYVRDDGTASSKTTARGPGNDTARCMSVTVFNASSFTKGDSIYYYDDGGVYDTIIVPPTAGITIKAGPGEHPIVSGSNNESTPSYDRNQGIFIQVDSVTVDGFEIRYCGQDNVWCGYTTKGTRLRNLDSHHSQYDGYKGVNTASFSMYKCRGRLNLDDGSSLHDSAVCTIDSSYLDSNGTDGAHNVQATSCTMTNTRCKGNAVGVHIGGHSTATIFRCPLDTNTSAGCFAYDTGVVVLDSCPVSGGEYGFHAQSYGVQTVKYCSFANHTYYGYWHEYGNSKQWLLNNSFKTCGNAAVIISEAMKLRAYRNRFYCNGFDFRANAEFNIAANIFDTSVLFSVKNASIKPGNLMENCYINNCDNVSLWGDTDTAWTVRNCIFRSPDGDNFYNVSKVIFDHCVSDAADIPDTLSNVRSAVIDSFVVSTDPASVSYALPKTRSIGTGTTKASENFTTYFNGYPVGSQVNLGANGLSSSSTAKKIFFFFNRRK